ncbi:CBO2463/CBO2479 domain-containing protein [Tepidibacter sp. Z1-5]|uniref:CBO2463/CBO2479 domain-containing protein n=1 Tax=Tepidibacter sp. Z1-5 TaxID=3134138 RepID=UPI0030C39554
MDRLKYSSTERMYEGVIVKITDGGVTIDLKGRLGQFKMPKRMLITDYELKLGMEVGFLLSYPEVLGPEVNEKYANVIAENQRREQEKNK